MVAYIGMLVKICAAYGMNMIPVRNFHYHCLGWDLDTTPYWKHCIMIILSSLVVLICGLASRTSTWPSAWWGLCAAASSASCSCALLDVLRRVEPADCGHLELHRHVHHDCFWRDCDYVRHREHHLRELLAN
eukprot:gene9400-biopygen6697